MTLGETRLAVVAGEASGDLHAGLLLEALSKRIPGLEAFGIGGDVMRKVGAEILHDVGSLAATGLWDAVALVPRLRHIRRDLIERIRSARPRAVILVDYPGFNLTLARSLRSLAPKPKLIYFIPPQVWAWWGARARQVAETFDLTLAILPFEPPYFTREGGRAEYVGNPVAYGLRDAPSREASREALGIGPDERVVALLPGSRYGEVARHMAPMVEAARELRGRFPRVRFLVSEAAAVPEGMVSGFLDPAEECFRSVRGRTHEVVRAADAAVVVSGTSSLECGILGTPMVVLYAMDYIGYLLAMYIFARVDYLSLVNLLAGRGVVPELYQREVRAGRIARSLSEVLENPDVRARQLEAFALVRRMLDGPDPYAFAAERICHLLETDE